MGAHNDTANDYQLFNTGGQTIADPGSGGTFNLRGIDRGIATIASGTRKLPNSTPVGVSLSVYATGAVTITNASGTTVLTLASGQIGVFTATSSTTWAGTMLDVGASVSLKELEVNATTTQAYIPIPLTSLRHVSSGAVGNITANGGVLASDTTPTLTPINGATDATQIVTWAASNNTVVMLQIPLPPDMEYTNSTTGLHFKLSSGGTSNAVGFTVAYYFEGIGAANSVASGTNQTTSYTEVTALVDSGDLNTASGAQTLTVLLTPVAHTTDTLRLKALWFEYKKSILTS